MAAEDPREVEVVSPAEPTRREQPGIVAIPPPRLQASNRGATPVIRHAEEGPGFLHASRIRLVTLRAERPGPVAQLVFKTSEPWQPHGGQVRLLCRSANPMTLFSPESHEALTNTAWDADRARSAIVDIVDAAEAAFDDGWLVHPDDDDESLTTKRLRSVYMGGAGVVDALHRLARRGFVDLHRDYVPYLEESAVAPMDWGDGDDTRSLSFGETGIRLVLQRLAPSTANLDRLTELINANVESKHCELMSGSPGTILAGREVGVDVTPSIEWLRSQRDEDGLWTQHGVGESPARILGAAHGFAGCALALGDAEGVSDPLRRYAVVEDGLVNWPAAAGSDLLDHGDKRVRVQWCHGAPGIVATLGSLLDEDLALGGGELTWRAGPLKKGAGLCHGTAGNGYAFLTLLERTGDELWLERARAFAMRALEQRQPERYSLWTGCLGVALYLADCVDGAGALPIP